MNVPVVTLWLFCGIALGNGQTQRATASSYDTIVVGLGASGVAAASTLARAGRRVLGLEAQGRVGGRVKTVPFGDGIVEEGAEWIHGKRPSPVYDLAVQNNVTVKEQDESMLILSSDGRSLDQELLLSLMEFCSAYEEEDSGEPQPLGQFITEKLRTYLKDHKPEVLNDAEFMEEFLYFMNLAISANQASNDWDDVSTGSVYVDLEGYKYLSWHRNGYRTLFEILLNTFNDGPGLPTLDIKIDTEVVKITWPESADATVSVETKSGEVYTADNVIVTMSVGVLKASHKTTFHNQLPAEKVKAIETIPIGVVGKIILSFPEPWWNNDQRSLAFFWKKSDREAVPKEHLWTTKVFGTSGPMGSSNTMTLWTGGETAKLVESLPENVVKMQSLGLLRRFVGTNETVPEPSGILRSTWFTNPYTRGSYSYDDLATVLLPNIRPALAEPITDAAGKPRVLFAGEATNPLHFATVHGAVETGFREARRLLGKEK